MDLFDKKIQAIRHICKQLEEIDAMLTRLQDASLIQECQNERTERLSQLKQLIKQ